jgi:hypothetical protein
MTLFVTLGSLTGSEHCWGEHRTVYSGRSKAGVIMTSIRIFVRELKRNVPRCNVICRSATLPFLLLGLLAIGSKGFSLVTGKATTKGARPTALIAPKTPSIFGLLLRSFWHSGSA